MTVAEIVKGMLTKIQHDHFKSCSLYCSQPFTQDDYEKAWLVVSLVKAAAESKCNWQDHTHAWCDVSIKSVQIAFCISPSDYAEVERRVREWKKGHDKPRMEE